jgi:hypothetical protein
MLSPDWKNVWIWAVFAGALCPTESLTLQDSFAMFPGRETPKDTSCLFLTLTNVNAFPLDLRRLS